MQWMVHTETETKELAKGIALHLHPGDVLALEGDLGAGKTTFAQGIAKALGVAGRVDSPTFTIIKEYVGRLPFYHMDVYRLEGAGDELGLEDYFYGDGICLVEWASRVESLLPEETIWMQFKVQDNGERQITISATHPRVNQLCEQLTKWEMEK